ncbi:MAG: prepilin-type N-terminal cleavage/methylation domain-containing protein [Alphaproteobacteria bacterium]
MPGVGNIHFSSPAVSGFTLVELAIVMTIIGLLIGGILKGQELIDNARLTMTVSQVQSFRAAHTTFGDLYQTLPGDTRYATSRLIGCVLASNCYDGDGDGVIGTASTNYSHDNQGGTIAAPAIETTMYWKHLALANLIGGVGPNSDPLAPVWGGTHPAAKIAGGFHVVDANEAGNNQALGHYYILRMAATGDPHPVANGMEPLSPAQASRIDRKVDDGNARTGEVRADDAAARCNIAGVGTYANGNSKDCLVIFQFQ